MRLLLLIPAVMLLAACGYKGPLYLPGEKPPAQKSRTAPAQSPTTPSGATP